MEYGILDCHKLKNPLCRVCCVTMRMATTRIGFLRPARSGLGLRRSGHLWLLRESSFCFVACAFRLPCGWSTSQAQNLKHRYAETPLGRHHTARVLQQKTQQLGCLLFTVSGSTPTPWSGPFRDHGLNPPLSIDDPRNTGFSGSGVPIFGFGLADPTPKG